MRAKTWAERIAEAEKFGTFTSADKDLADSWPTCKVGECHADLPDPSRVDLYDFVFKNELGLARLGHDFNTAVLANDAAQAKRIAAEIEKRVAGRRGE